MLQRILISLLLLLVVSSLINASDLPQSRTSSYYKYIYKLTYKEARSIYKKGLVEVNENYFHTLTDSVPNDSVFNAKLPQGNYLLVWAQQNELKFEMRSYSNIDVMIHNNYVDLLLTIADTTGNKVTDAKVKIDGAVVKYKPELEAYQSTKKNKRGWLEITYNHFTSYHYLGNNVKKGVKFRKVVFSVPVKYVYVPLRLLVFLPYDVVMSAYRLQPQGLPYYVYRPFKDMYLSIFRYGTYGWIKGLVRRWEKTFDKDYEGYMIFSQPKYKPNDTVRFKAFVLRPNGTPISNQPLEAYMKINNKNVKLKELVPDHRGSYAYEFVLHDSLQLKLDQHYRVSLKRDGWNTLMSNSFKYEEYELNSTQYHVRVDKTTQLKGKPFFVYLKGEDMNGLNVPDGRVKIFLKSKKHFTKLYTNRAYLPDTLYKVEKNLDPVGETMIEIPDSIFPPMDFSYDLEAVFLTGDNERIQKSKQISYYHNKEDISLDVRNDSICFVYKKLDIGQKVMAAVTAYDKNGNLFDDQFVNLPCEFPVNNQVSAYAVKTNELSRYFDLSQFTPSLSVSSNRTHHSVELFVVNPDGIWFNYFVYKKDKEWMHGYTQKLDTILKWSSNKGCFVSLNYQWAGKPYHQSFDIPVYKKQLNVSLHQPQVIYPGQKTDITVEVTDYKNKPVSGVDLTAYGLTKKFSYSTPTLSYYGKDLKPRTMFNNYPSIGDTNFGASSQIMLNYAKWKNIMHLDTITYYQFSRPNEGVYTELLNTEDHNTQFAPYVFINGVPQQIHFIFLDYQLLYSSISTTKDPYSFKCTSGYHKLRLRTTSQDITIDSVYFRYAKKNLISIDPSKVSNHVMISKCKPVLSREEQRLIRTRYAKFNVASGNGLVYIQQRDNRYVLKDDSSVGYHYYAPVTTQVIAGPFNTDIVNYICKDNYTTDFKFESSYLYTIDERIIKMKTNDHFWHFNLLMNNHTLPAYTDLVLTENELNKIDKKIFRQRIKQRIQYNNPYSTSRGNGTLAMEYSLPEINTSPLRNILVFKDDNPLYMSIYPGNTHRIHDLEPGSYRLFFSMSNGSYFQEEHILVKANNMTACKVVEPDSLLKDETSDKIAQLIEDNWLKDDMDSSNNTHRWYAEREIRSTYQRSQLDYSNSREIIGRVVDVDDHTGIPGVNVMIKGTDIGTMSDMEGNYAIEIPQGSWELVFSFIGYQTIEVPVSYSEEINVALVTEKTALEEVVVIGYGTQQKMSLTGSFSTVPGSLHGKIAGVSVVSSGSPGIRIRGGNSVNSSDKPLVIVDGMPVELDVSAIDLSTIAEMNILKDDVAASIYGARGANGVIIITTKSGKGIPGSTQINDMEIPLQVGSTNSLRTNFSDMAYWQPNLITDSKGKATFNTTFPDDITSWRTFALAVGKNKRTGQVQGEVKSYNPVSAQLFIPRFLTQGDSVAVIGKSVNYLSDSIQISTEYKVDSIPMGQWNRTIGRVQVDSLSLKAEGRDTLSVTYSLARKNGYFDGEMRKVPVVPMGVVETDGEFFTMNTDTVISFSLPESCTGGLLYLESNSLNILWKETQHLRNYSHLCNEQASSKLMALLSEEKICTYLQKDFKYKKGVDILIQRLQKSTNNNGIWGWWSGLKTEWWITCHVVEALEKAKKAGYKVVYDREKVKYELLNRFAIVNSREQLNILQTLEVMKAQVDHGTLIAQLNDSTFGRIDSLRLALIKQKVNISIDLTSFIKDKKETLYGNYYWGKPSWSLFYGQIQETLLMYQILQNDGGYESWLPKIRNFFYEKRSGNGWRNTYESALIVNHLLPDLLLRNTGLEKCGLMVLLNGKEMEVDRYPFSLNLNPSDTVSIKKSGDQVVFAGWNSKYFNAKPVAKEDCFQIKTSFKKDDEEVVFLTAGERVSLFVDIEVKKKSDYLLLEIPIPSVCSYYNKPQYRYHESHREYHKEKVNIYYNSLPKGKYQVEIELVPRYTGKVYVNSSRMEHMYFPVFYGNNEVKEVVVSD